MIYEISARSCRAYDPRFLFAWPNSRISVMGGPQAAEVLATVKQDQLRRQGKSAMTEQELKDFKRPTLEKYELEGGTLIIGRCPFIGRSIKGVEWSFYLQV